MADPKKHPRADQAQDDRWPETAGASSSEPDPDLDATDEALSLQADDEVERLRSELDEASKRLLMAQADLENFRKRVRRDYEDQIRYAAVPLLQDILQVRDNLDRALAASAATEGQPAGGLREGVAMVARLLQDTLAKHGCVAIPTLGEPFDPNVHEAISQMQSDEYPAGYVAHQVVAGYRLHERVLRPSQVVVSTGPAES